MIARIEINILLQGIVASGWRHVEDVVAVDEGTIRGWRSERTWKTERWWKADCGALDVKIGYSFWGMAGVRRHCFGDWEQINSWEVGYQKWKCERGTTGSGKCILAPHWRVKLGCENVRRQKGSKADMWCQRSFAEKLNERKEYSPKLVVFVNARNDYHGRA